jgi:hypothetical protein
MRYWYNLIPFRLEIVSGEGVCVGGALLIGGQIRPTTGNELAIANGVASEVIVNVRGDVAFRNKVCGSGDCAFHLVYSPV